MQFCFRGCGRDVAGPHTRPLTLVALVLAAACRVDAPVSTGPRIADLARPDAAVIGSTVTILPSLGGGTTYAADINDAGTVVGQSVVLPSGGRSHAFVWTPSDGIRDLGTLGGEQSYAAAINESGQVVGASEIAGSYMQHAFLWTPAHGMQDLGTLGGDRSVARDINDNGEVVGDSRTASGETHAFLWTSSQGMRDLGAFGAPPITAIAINNAGQVAGTFGAPDAAVRAFLWTPGKGMRDLGALDGDPTVALGLNEQGWVVGRTHLGPDSRAFLWTPEQGMRDLGTLGGPAVGSAAMRVNDAGQVVGYSRAANLRQHAFIWSAQEGMEDLYAATELDAAMGINNRGQVISADRVATLQFRPPNRAPVASIGGPYVGFKKKPVAFDGTHSSDPDGDVLTCVWDFGDGSPHANGASPSHAYDAWGTYTVTLRVSDAAGLFDVQTTAVTIAPPGHLKSTSLSTPRMPPPR